MGSNSSSNARKVLSENEGNFYQAKRIYEHLSWMRDTQGIDITKFPYKSAWDKFKNFPAWSGAWDSLWNVANSNNTWAFPDSDLKLLNGLQDALDEEWAPLVTQTNGVSPTTIQKANDLYAYLARTGRVGDWPYYWTPPITTLDPLQFGSKTGVSEFTDWVSTTYKTYLSEEVVKTRTPTAAEREQAKQAGITLLDSYDTKEAYEQAIAQVDDALDNNVAGGGGGVRHSNKFGLQNVRPEDINTMTAQQFAEAYGVNERKIPESELRAIKALQEARNLGNQIVGGPRGIVQSSGSAALVDQAIDQVEDLRNQLAPSQPPPQTTAPPPPAQP